MPTTTEHIYKRLTHRYRDGWSGLDESKYLASLRLTAPKLIEAPVDFDQGGTFERVARLPAGLSRHQRADLAQAVASTLGGSRCTHEHDCCGCARRSVTTHVQGRRLRVLTSITFNH